MANSLPAAAYLPDDHTMPDSDIRDLRRRAVEASVQVVSQATTVQLGNATPCARVTRKVVFPASSGSE